MSAIKLTDFAKRHYLGQFAKGEFPIQQLGDFLSSSEAGLKYLNHNKGTIAKWDEVVVGVKSEEDAAVFIAKYFPEPTTETTKPKKKKALVTDTPIGFRSLPSLRDLK